MKLNQVAHESVEREVLTEKTSALVNATRQLEKALADLAAADAQSASPSSVASELRAEALAHARERLWYLVIQREILGLHRHDDLIEILQVPREVHAAMGPRRKPR